MTVVLLLSMQGIVGYRHRSHGVGVKARPNHAASASVDLISLLLRDRLPRRAPVRQHGIQSHHLSLPWSPLPLRSPRSSCRARPRIQKVGGRRAPRSSLAPSSNGRPLPLLSLPRLDRYASSLHRLSIVFCLGACLAPRELSSRPAAALSNPFPFQHAIAVGPVRSKGFTTLTHSLLGLPVILPSCCPTQNMHRISRHLDCAQQGFSTGKIGTCEIRFVRNTFAASRASLYENGLDGTSRASSHVISFFCEET